MRVQWSVSQSVPRLVRELASRLDSLLDLPKERLSEHNLPLEFGSGTIHLDHRWGRNLEDTSDQQWVYQWAKKMVEE